MTIETVSFVQIVTTVTSKGAVIYGLTANGAVYGSTTSVEKSGFRFRCERSQRTKRRESVIELRGPSRTSEEG